MHPSFKSDLYSKELQKQYVRLLDLSHTVISEPKSRDLAMLEKIEAFEERLRNEDLLSAPKWDPVKATLNNDFAVRKDCEMQKTIYGLETSLRTISVLDDHFGEALKQANNDIVEAEKERKMAKARYLNSPTKKGEILQSMYGTRRQKEGVRQKDVAVHRVQQAIQISSSLPDLRRPNFPISKVNRSSTSKLSNSIKHKSNRTKHKSNSTKKHKSKRKKSTLNKQPSTLNKNSSLRQPAGMFWGRPSYFGGKNAPRSSDLFVNQSTMKHSERRAEAIDAEQKEKGRIATEVELIRRRESDYELFTLLVERYGPLDGMVFCHSVFPGRAYSTIVYKAACMLQLWFKIFYPIRVMLTENSAAYLQRVFRGFRSRRRAKRLRMHRDRFKVFALRMRSRNVYKAFKAWEYNVNQRVGCRRILKRVIHGRKIHFFWQWSDNVTAIVEWRQHKLRYYLAKMMNAELYQRWLVWKTKVDQRKLLKRFAKKLKNRQLNSAFMGWWERLKNEKLKRQRQQSALDVQRMYRGRTSARKTAEFKEKFYRSIIKIQNAYRGHGAREFVKSRQRSLFIAARKIVQKQRKQKRKEKLREVHRLELARLASEREHIHKVINVLNGKQGRQKFNKYLYSKVGKEKLKQLKKKWTEAQRKGLEGTDEKVSKIAKKELFEKFIEGRILEELDAYRKEHPPVEGSNEIPNLKSYIEYQRQNLVYNNDSK